MRGRGSRQNLEGWARKRTTATPPPRKPGRQAAGTRVPPAGAAQPAAVLPMQLQVGDRYTDEEGEWEIAARPFTTREGKLVHATVQKPGEDGSAREKTWPAHERLAIRRDATSRPPDPTQRRDRSRKKR